MKRKVESNHSWLEWLALSFFTLALTSSVAGSFNVKLISVALILIGFGYCILFEISKLEYSPVKFFVGENALRVYFNSSEDELVAPEQHGVIRHISSAAEWINGKLKSEPETRILTSEYPVTGTEPETLIANRDSGILNGSEIIDFSDYFSGPEYKAEKIHKLLIPPVEPIGQTAGIIKAKQEITFQKESSETLEEYQHFFNHCHDLICVVRQNGTLDQLNLSFEKTLGYAKNELLGKQFISFVHPEDIELTLTGIDKLGTEGGCINFINRCLKMDGSHIWLEWTIRAGSRNSKWYGIARDFTDRYKAEIEIDHLNAQLEQKVNERTQQLESANQELEAFTYSVSHDLRAPLRAVGSYTQILEEDYLNLLDEEGRRLLLVIRSSAEKMGTLIDDLLAFSRLGKQSIQKTKVDMNECTRDVLEVLKQVYRHKATIHIHPLPGIFCDGALIRQVLSNLLSNAIKYSSKKDNPVIEIFARQEGQDMVFCITDNGSGFDMKYVQKLFGVFQRLHTEKEYEGTGVGLAIADRIIAKHGGKIWAESMFGKGAAFYFSLPVEG